MGGAAGPTRQPSSWSLPLKKKEKKRKYQDSFEPKVCRTCAEVMLGGKKSFTSSLVIVCPVTGAAGPTGQPSSWSLPLQQKKKKKRKYQDSFEPKVCRTCAE